MTSTLLIVQIVLAIAITISVLLQKSSSIGLGAYSGSNESMFGAKGPMGFLAKLTFTLGLLFILNTLVLGYLYTKENSKTVADTIASSIPVSPETQKVAAPAAPAAPATADTQTSAAAPTVPSAPAAAATEANSTIPKPPETEKRSEPATH